MYGLFCCISKETMKVDFILLIVYMENTRSNKVSVLFIFMLVFDERERNMINKRCMTWKDFEVSSCCIHGEPLNFSSLDSLKWSSECKRKSFHSVVLFLSRFYVFDVGSHVEVLFINMVNLSINNSSKT